MGYKALYRLYRPSTFEQVVGQKHIVKTLKNAIKNDRIAHAYIFCGPRGTGKTSIAKIFAKAVNCTNSCDDPCNTCKSCVAADDGSHPDIVEMDAASNNGVDKIRDLIEQVAFSPMMGKYKVYIIDEVHMLSAGAFNALLKTLEEPPSHVIFILATTNPEKVLPTILSRCQRFDFGRVSEEDIFGALKRVAKSSNINADEDALRLVARLADGGMRDALSILDQCYAYESEHLTEQNVEDIYGLVSVPKLIQLLNEMKEGNAAEVVSQVQGYIQSGTDIQRFVMDMTNIMKDLMVYKHTFSLDLMSVLNEEEINSISQNITKAQIQSILNILSDVNEKIRFSNVSASYFEVGVMRIMDVLSTVEAVEEPVPVKKQVVKKKTQPKMETDTTVIAEPEEPVVVKEPVKEKSPMLNDVLAKSNSKIAELTKNVSRETFLTEEDKKEVLQAQNNLKQQIQDDIMLDDELLLSILVSANRQLKEQDNQAWKNLDQFKLDSRYSVYAGMMTSASIIASSSDSIIISVLTKGSANMLNQANDAGTLQPLMEEVLHAEKEVIALTKEESNQLVELFRKRRAEGTLPEAYEAAPIQREKKPTESIKKEEPREQTALDRLNALFGEGNVDIVEGEYHE